MFAGSAYNVTARVPTWPYALVWKVWQTSSFLDSKRLAGTNIALNGRVCSKSLKRFTIFSGDS